MLYDTNFAADVENWEDATAFVIVATNTDGSSPVVYGPHTTAAAASAVLDRLLAEQAECNLEGRTYRLAPVINDPWTA